MTELDTIKRAKMYLEKLSCGIDPLTDTPIPKEDVAAAPRMQKCFQYVTGLLTQIIEDRAAVEEKTAEKPQEEAALELSIEEAISLYEYSTYPISISEFLRKLNTLADPSPLGKVRNRDMTQWLLEIGALEEIESLSGKIHKMPTEDGNRLGITTDIRYNTRQEKYTAVLYDKNAQQFLLDNIYAILAIRDRRKEEKQQQKENKGKPWTVQEEEQLMQMYNAHLSTAAISQALMRTPGAIRSRIKCILLQQEETLDDGL